MALAYKFYMSRAYKFYYMTLQLFGNPSFRVWCICYWFEGGTIYPNKEGRVEFFQHESLTKVVCQTLYYPGKNHTNMFSDAILRFSICAYVCICMRMYMCVHVCVYRCMRICMYMYMCMSVYMYSYTFIYTRVWVYICTRVDAFCLFVLSNLSATCACITGVS